ncbi:MAG: diacylglycerol kinase [Rhodobacterales bacterium]|nr:MAG: diacylglycerol kinase [Rhodobacterales bacterium]
MIAREWRRFVNRCVWSWAGWVDTWQNEPSLKFWTTINVLSALAALAFPLTFAERAVILPLGVLILAMELINTAVERTVDYISTKDHDLARRAKDAASAAVALAAIAAGVAWVVITWRIWAG